MKLLRRGEYHSFQAAGAPFLYLVPSAAVYRLDETSQAVLDEIGDRDVGATALADSLSTRFPSAGVRASIEDLVRVRAVKMVAEPVYVPRAEPPRKRIPLTTLVVNVTSKCNLSCTYCYEYGDDKIVEASTKPRFMTEETARQSVDFMFAESGDSPVVHLTFFGGETLLNFKVLKSALAYANARAAVLGKRVDTSLTTNATLLRDEVIDWLVENDVGVTVSIDGGREQQDRFRTFSNGMGSYDVILPNIKQLLARHRRRPVGARVTLTRQNLDVVGIYRHLFEELGFYEVGFAPVTTSWQRDYAIQDEGFFAMLAQFELLAQEYLQHAMAGKRHGFSNVRDTLEEIHKGMSKAYPCGAGLGLMGVATDGDVALCHRFAGSNSHKLGSVTEGVDREKQDDYLTRHHIANKTDCATCWARPLCAGGCYHEANTRYGSTEKPNLHYCDWIRSWTNTCLEVYGALAEKKPEFLAQFD
ncbi:MAG TPA: quinohemoprotein amine dehydrogenase maturation protein [Gemmatimonadaceae bacterium]|nr:quinohemoprotein amine dehydrogenase maturation protein [Gemmatimonadaceae bacterium]